MTYATYSRSVTGKGSKVAEVVAQRTLLGEVLGVLGLGGVTACLLLVGYGIGWLARRCLDHDDNAPR